MKRMLKCSLSWILVVMLSISCLTAAVSAEAVPTVDGVKDAAYSDDKMTVVSTAFDGPNGGSISNTADVVVKTWYTWDETSNYIYMEVTDTTGVGVAEGLDVVYYCNHTNIAAISGFILVNAGGGYFQRTNATDALTSVQSNTVPTASEGSKGDGVRCLELSFPRDPNADGFMFDSVAYVNAHYAVAYDTAYNTIGMKVVKYDDDSTWKEEKLEAKDDPIEPGDSVVDGVKDERYSDDKMTVVSTAFGGQSQPATKNPAGVVVKTWYTWDDTSNYIYMEVEDPTGAGAAGWDLVYYANHANIGAIGGFIFSNAGGGYIQKTVASGALTSDSSNNPPTEAISATGENGVRILEFSFPRDPNAEGFMFDALAYISASYVVAYGSNYNSTDMKIVKYNDESTWKEEKIGETGEDPGPDPKPEDPLLDGVKDDRYSDDKMTEISTAYAASGQAAVTNTEKIVTKVYYAWDDDYNHIFVEINDPNSKGTDDVFYYMNQISAAPEEWIFNAAGGGYFQHTLATDGYGEQGTGHQYKFVQGENGVRCYEINIPRDSNAVGFAFNVVVLAGYAVTYAQNFYVSGESKKVAYNDKNTWLDQTKVDPSLKPVDPDKEDYPIGDEGIIDGLFDARYSEDKMTEISVAYAGSGGMAITNSHNIYSKTYYAWDDVNNYVYVDIYDAEGKVELDVFYYMNNTATVGGNIFEAPGGGYFNRTVATGAVQRTDSNLEYAFKQKKGIRSYEFVIPKGEGADGFVISPVIYYNAACVVSYSMNYYIIPECKTVLYNAAETHLDRTKVDPKVMNDPEKIKALEAELRKLPEDANTLTLDDQELVNSVEAAVKMLPENWLSFVDKDLYARYTNAKQRMLDLEAEQRKAEIEAVEALITALPEDVDISNREAVMQAKEAADALGELAVKINETLRQKLNKAVGRLEALSSPVKVDGKLDPAYREGTEYEILMEFGLDSSSNVLGTDPDSHGVIYTMADEKYAYIYVEVFDKNIVPVPEDTVWSSNLVNNYDCITTYLDMDPSNTPTGVPYTDLMDSSCTNSWFTMLADGTVPDMYLNDKTQYLKNESGFVPFVKEGSYGYELKVPRVEGEESFRVMVLFADPAYKTNEAGENVLDSEASRVIALGAEWAHFYTNWGEQFFEDDYAIVPNYNEVIELINSLPAADAIKDKSCERTAKEARWGYDLLNEDQKPLVPAEVVKHLTDVEAALAAVIVVDVTYGDLNDDGKIDAKDALMVLRAAVGKLDLTEDQQLAGDVDSSGKLDAVDALLILRKAVNKLDKFPVEVTA